MLSVLIDASSKWPEIIIMNKATSAETILVLENLFARYGLCTIIVSDNGTQFTSEELERFCVKRGLTHMKTAPGHSQSNGQAEMYVEIVETAMKME